MQSPRTSEGSPSDHRKQNRTVEFNRHRNSMAQIPTQQTNQQISSGERVSQCQTQRETMTRQQSFARGKSVLED